MKFLTESGSIYEIDGNHVRRINEGYEKRADGEWVRLVDPPLIVREGEPVVLRLESLANYGPDDYENTVQVTPDAETVRVTTPVVRVWDDE